MKIMVVSEIEASSAGRWSDGEDKSEKYAGENQVEETAVLYAAVKWDGLRLFMSEFAIFFVMS
jgi:hypothetical protein